MEQSKVEQNKLEKGRMDQNLEEAIEQLRRGEQQGFQILYDQTHHYVFMQARMLLKNEADACDLVQEVYWNAYRSIDSLEENQKIYAWLGGIAFRQATKILRKQRDVLIRDEEEGIFDTIVELDPDIQPEQALDKAASAQILTELLEELPELQRAALLAYYYNEMSIKEIAKTYSCSEGTIKSRLNYARKSLKESVAAREKIDGIRLHSLSLPLLLLAYELSGQTCQVEAAVAENVYQKSADRITNKALERTAESTRTGEKGTNSPGEGKGLFQAVGRRMSARSVAVLTSAVVGIGAITGGIYIYEKNQKEAPVAVEQEAPTVENQGKEEPVQSAEKPDPDLRTDESKEKKKKPKKKKSKKKPSTDPVKTTEDAEVPENSVPAEAPAVPENAAPADTPAAPEESAPADTPATPEESAPADIPTDTPAAPEEPVPPDTPTDIPASPEEPEDSTPAEEEPASEPENSDTPEEEDDDDFGLESPEIEVEEEN